MRITGGRARGIVLQLPKRGHLRPATSFLREAVFSSLAARVPGTRVLDLFAGTGAYGLEAVSRGAQHATLVDANHAAVEVMRTNLAAVAKAMDGADAAQIGLAVEGDVFKWQPPTGAVFDLIFVNPPYALWEPFGKDLVERAAAWMAPGSEGRLLLEAPGEFEPPIPAGWELTRRLGKGGGRQPNSVILRRAN
jgi:16S rRNA (guanine966-N2)-methyltransferase